MLLLWFQEGPGGSQRWSRRVQEETGGVPVCHPGYPAGMKTPLVGGLLPAGTVDLTVLPVLAVIGVSCFALLTVGPQAVRCIIQ